MCENCTENTKPLKLGPGVYAICIVYLHLYIIFYFLNVTIELISHLLVQIVDRFLDVNTVRYLVLRHFCDSWKLRRQYLLLVMTALIGGHPFEHHPQ